MSELGHRVSIVVPIKELSRAKSRLAVSPEQRRHVSYAMAEHSITVATSCVAPPQVFVVTRDPEIMALAARLGASRVAEAGVGLNAAAGQGVQEATTRATGNRVVVMVADLPRITRRALMTFLSTLERVRDHPVLVPDISGRGTTLLALPPKTSLQMVFGRDSAARFGALGCYTVHNVPDCLRADLDTVQELDAATSAGWARGLELCPLESP